MRTMMKCSNNEVKVDVYEHIILSNCWEYYLIQSEFDTEDDRYALVMGNRNEFGGIYLPELKPYIRSRTKDLDGVGPASGFQWEDDSNE